MTDFQFSAATNSQSQPPPLGGSEVDCGWYDGVFNANAAACGTLLSTPPAKVFGTGAQASAIAYANAGGGVFGVVIYGHVGATYWGTVRVKNHTSGWDQTYNASAMTYTEGSAGTGGAYSSWSLSGVTTPDFSQIGATWDITFTPGSPQVPTPTGNGQITDPKTWQDLSTGALPPVEYDGVPGAGGTHNTTVRDGRYSWFGNATSVTGGQIAFVGDPTELTSTASLTWTILQRSTDGSKPQIQVTTDGTTYTSVSLGSEGTAQQSILESGVVHVALGSATKFSFNVVSTGGTAAANKKPWIVTVAITRNNNETLQWDSTNPFNPRSYNASPLDLNGQPTQTLAALRKRMMIRLGFSVQSTNPPPGMADLINEFLSEGQSYLWREYEALQTRRFFRWKMIPNQRYYSLADNDEDVPSGFHMDPLKTIEWGGVQDTRNVWYPLIEGIPPQLYTMIDKPWRPARYTIRQGLEVYPAPDQTYYLWLRGHTNLKPLVADGDTTTLDCELVFLHSLANAKAHYGQPDAQNIGAQAMRYLANLVAKSHGTKTYIPNTMAVPPAVRPTLIGFQDGATGS